MKAGRIFVAWDIFHWIHLNMVAPTTDCQWMVIGQKWVDPHRAQYNSIQPGCPTFLQQRTASVLTTIKWATSFHIVRICALPPSSVPSFFGFESGTSTLWTKIENMLIKWTYCVRSGTDSRKMRFCHLRSLCQQTKLSVVSKFSLIKGYKTLREWRLSSLGVPFHNITCTLSWVKHTKTLVYE